MRYHCMPAGVAETQNTDMIKCWQGWRTTGTLTHCWWECRVARPLSKAVQWFPSQLSILLTYDPGIMLLGIYSNELKTYVQYKNMHIDVCQSFIHNCQHLEATKMPFGR